MFSLETRLNASKRQDLE